MNEIERQLEMIREYHSKPNRKQQTGKQKLGTRKRMIIESQQKKYKSNG